MSWEVKSISNYWFFTNLRWLIIDLKVNKVTWPHFWLCLLNLFYLYFMHFFGAIETRKYQTNFMISLYWCDLYCISISVTGLFFKRPEYTFDVYLRHFFTIIPPDPFPNCPYKIYDIYNVLTFFLAFLTHFGTYRQ
jgi:hypothetical protein